MSQLLEMKLGRGFVDISRNVTEKYTSTLTGAALCFFFAFRDGKPLPKRARLHGFCLQFFQPWWLLGGYIGKLMMELVRVCWLWWKKAFGVWERCFSLEGAPLWWCSLGGYVWFGVRM